MILSLVLDELQSELLAEVGALELLWPFQIRRKMITDTIDPDVIAKEFCIPLRYAILGIEPGYNESVEWLFENTL